MQNKIPANWRLLTLSRRWRAMKTSGNRYRMKSIAKKYNATFSESRQINRKNSRSNKVRSLPSASISTNQINWQTSDCSTSLSRLSLLKALSIVKLKEFTPGVISWTSDTQKTLGCASAGEQRVGTWLHKTVYGVKFREFTATCFRRSVMQTA